MENESVKEQLIQATIRLLVEKKDVSKITARQIVATSGSTLGMINYYFDSKDALITTAVKRLIAERAVEAKAIMSKDVPPRQKLLEFLVKVSDITVEYAQYTKSTIPYVLLEQEIEEPYHILPIIKEYFGNERTEIECRIIAYQLTSFSQIAFYRATDFKKYTGIDVLEQEQRTTLFYTLIGILGLE